MTAPPARNPSRKVGLWLIGAFGGVGTTAALGLSEMSRSKSRPVGMVTALPLFDGLDLDPMSSFVVGGHDIRDGSFSQTANELHQRSNIFHAAQLDAASSDLAAWSANVRPGSIVEANATIAAMSQKGRVQVASTPTAAVDQIAADMDAFRVLHDLEQVVVVNVASTEPPFPGESHTTSLCRLDALQLPASSLYAYAAIKSGFAYVNFTPSAGASVPAIQRLAEDNGVPIAGRDGKTGETLLKTVLAPMFAHRNLRVLSWVGHNILGGGDGRVLADPTNKASKMKTKDAVLDSLMGYKPQTHVSIEYVESLDDWKTAWDHIHFEGFLGTKMTMQFTWQGCDSILAAPLVLDLARLTLLAQRRGESGVLKHLASFFKSPMGVDDHDYFRQFMMLGDYVAAASSSSPASTVTVGS